MDHHNGTPSKRRIKKVSSSNSNSSSSSGHGRQRQRYKSRTSTATLVSQFYNGKAYKAVRAKCFVVLATAGIITCLMGGIMLIKIADDHSMQNMRQRRKHGVKIDNLHSSIRRRQGSVHKEMRVLHSKQQQAQQEQNNEPHFDIGTKHNDNSHDTDNVVTDNPGKERVIHMLKEAGIDDLDDDTIQRLPTWSQITSLYGDGPKVYGLEDHCPAFQSRVPISQRFVGPAGPFNSGTNLLADLLVRNCHNVHDPQVYYSYEKENHIRWQVPWGKHNPPTPETFRQDHRAGVEGKVVTNADDVLSVVTIRDPYVWMKSMCRHSYSASWIHDETSNCPNLVGVVPYQQQQHAPPGASAVGQQGNPVRVQYKQQNVVHESLAHMWNEFYDPYFTDTATNNNNSAAGGSPIDTSDGFNRIIVRYEDLVFYPKETLELICNCYGGQFGGKNGKFQYVKKSAKFGEFAHGKNEQKIGYVEAIIRYGSEIERLQGISQIDQQYAIKTLRQDMMDYFGYKNPPLNP